MGRESAARVTFEGRVSQGKALLETSEIIFRGDFRLRIPLAELTAVAERDGSLDVTWPSGCAVFELGAEAAVWSERLRNPRGLLEKLGVRPGDSVALLGVDNTDFLGRLRDLAATVTHGAIPEGTAHVFFAADEVGDLTKLAEVRAAIGDMSAVWVVSPKGKGARILEVGANIASLQDILRPPQLRGGFGEMLMERLLAEVVPGRYTCQYRFRGGEAVDAVVHLVGGLVPVDSKFPLDAFSRLLAATTEEERRLPRRDFERAVRGHIDAVARYIRADEGTLDFALMYIPAENVYYELHRAETTGGTALFTYAHERRVFPVSPSTFYMYLSAIALGLRGLRVEESAREIVGHLSRLTQEFERFQREFGVLGGHLEGARKKYESLSLGLQRFGDRLALPLGATAEDERVVGQPSLLSDRA